MSQPPAPPEPQGPRLRLVFISGPRSGEHLDLPMPSPGGPTLMVGRLRECAIQIESSDVSRRHAEIYISPDGHLLIHDLGSINKTFVNDQPAEQTAPLSIRPGDRIKVGLSELLFEGTTALLPPLPNLPPTSRVTPPPGETGKATVADFRSPAVQAQKESYIYLFLRNGQRYLFDGEEATIGRGQANDIVIDSNSISRLHARLTRTAAGVFVTDMGSTNKTFVNGVPADAPVLLHSGDVLRFGDIEADFKIEEQRLSTFINVRDYLQNNLDDTTERDIAGDRTYISFGDQTSLEIPSNSSTQIRRNIEEGATNLNIGLMVVGRNQRQVSSALPEPSPVGALPARPTPQPARFGAEVARLEGISYTEGTGRAAMLLLRDISLGLRQGELVALVGPSGSGKTELLQIMGGFLAADRGQVYVFGYQIPTHENWRGRKRLNLEEEREHVRWRNRTIGYMTSDLNQLNPRLSVLEQLTTTIEQAGIITDARRRHDMALERLALVGLTDPEIPRLKPGDLNRREKQLVALARALANDPPLVLADEPTGNLPSEAANHVFQLLQQLVAAGKTVFMVTHDQYWARNASRQIEILDGEIVGGLA